MKRSQIMKQQSIEQQTQFIKSNIQNKSGRKSINYVTQSINCRTSRNHCSSKYNWLNSENNQLIFQNWKMIQVANIPRMTKLCIAEWSTMQIIENQSIESQNQLIEILTNLIKLHRTTRETRIGSKESNNNKNHIASLFFKSYIQSLNQQANKFTQELKVQAIQSTIHLHPARNPLYHVETVPLNPIKNTKPMQTPTTHLQM